MAIYTKKGDKGETSIFANDKKISKSSLRISAIGTVDEVNSALGASLAFSKDTYLKKTIVGIQKDLFTLGSILAGSKLRFSIAKTKKLEKIIDKLEGSLPVLKNFILPGGTKTASLLHLARSFARRSEREVVALSEVEAVRHQILVYLNRLSDLIFMLAREANAKKKASEVIWKGRKN